MIKDNLIFIKKLRLFTITILLFTLTGCSFYSSLNSNAMKNKNYAKNTFFSYYSSKKSDLVINEDTEEWGDLKCGECTYYEFDSYSANSTDKNSFHNVMIIRSSNKAISWFIYDDYDFSTYIMSDNFDINSHAKNHKLANGNIQSSVYNADYEWWEENVYASNENSTISYFESPPTETTDTRYIAVFAGKNIKSSTELAFVFTDKNGAIYREYKVDMSTAEYRDFSVWEGGRLSDGELSYGWHYNFLSASNDFFDYYIHSDGTKSIMITIYDEFLGVNFPIFFSGTYYPVEKPPEW